MAQIIHLRGWGRRKVTRDEVGTLNEPAPAPKKRAAARLVLRLESGNTTVTITESSPGRYQVKTYQYGTLVETKHRRQLAEAQALALRVAIDTFVLNPEVLDLLMGSRPQGRG